MKDLLKIFCDFDGTISTVDVTNLILSRLADPLWNEIEGEWIRGEIGSRECLERQIPLIHGGWKAVESVLDEVLIDPAFADFAAACVAEKIPLAIVSDGLDRVIHFFLKRENIQVEVRANELIEDPSGNFSVRFPYPSTDKSCHAGLCKCRFLSDSGRQMKIVMGDGQSDYCWAGKADFVFAKSRLLAYCRQFGIAHEPFESFNGMNLMKKVQL